MTASTDQTPQGTTLVGAFGSNGLPSANAMIAPIQAAAESVRTLRKKRTRINRGKVSVGAIVGRTPVASARVVAGERSIVSHTAYAGHLATPSRSTLESQSRRRTGSIGRRAGL